MLQPKQKKQKKTKKKTLRKIADNKKVNLIEILSTVKLFSHTNVH